MLGSKGFLSLQLLSFFSFLCLIENMWNRLHKCVFFNNNWSQFTKILSFEVEKASYWHMNFVIFFQIIYFTFSWTKIIMLSLSSRVASHRTPNIKYPLFFISSGHVVLYWRMHWILEPLEFSWILWWFKEELFFSFVPLLLFFCRGIHWWHFLDLRYYLRSW